MEWKKLKKREANEEEKNQGHTFVWEGETPELFNEVLISDGEYVWVDTWNDLGFGIGFGSVYADEECWWLPFPPAPREEKL